jgi:crotonobetainyl-CoA:carnitine CoA-transferase CaiB-like acyl-CoA transferase
MPIQKHPVAPQRPLLQGVTVVEWGEHISAPLGGKLLAELGAEVIKVEPPKTGESARRTPPYFRDEPGVNNSLFFEYFNAGKQGVTVDVASSSGRDLFLRLLKTADALIENIPVPRKRDLRLTYADIATASPSIIMASLSPFGQTGPYSELVSDDLTTFAMTGSAYNNPRVMDRPGRPPLQYPGNTPAFLAGHQGATAIVMALIRRQERGLGASIDIAEAEIQSSLQHAALSRYEHEGIWERASGTGGTSSPYDSLPCKDGYVGIYCPQEDHWHRLLKVIGMPEVSEIELFNDGARRRQHWPEIWDMISPWFMAHGKEEIYRLCQENDIPSGAVYDIGETLKDAQFLARNAFPKVQHPSFGLFPYLRPPYDLTGESWQRHAFAPRLGQHTAQVLAKRLGVSKAKFGELKREGIV